MNGDHAQVQSGLDIYFIMMVIYIIYILVSVSTFDFIQNIIELLIRPGLHKFTSLKLATTKLATNKAICLKSTQKIIRVKGTFKVF